MYRMLIAAYVSAMLLGCAEPQSPPVTAPPVTIQIPAEPAVENVPETGGLQGTWSHTLPSNTGDTRTLVLKYIKDETGPERFEFVQHDWADKPVFAEKITNGRETELRFKMVKPTNETEETPNAVRYVIKAENGKWVGKLFESWTEVPYDVVLTKTK